MGIEKDGILAEKAARLWLKNKGVNNLQQIDWLFKSNKNGNYYCLESKSRELYEPPPFFGTGLDITQLKLRLQLLNDLGIDTILLVFEKNTNNVYWQFLSIMEKGRHIDTKNKIRIYDIDNFNKEESC
ncbi:MAG: hypothetical protein ABFD06_07235 [Smithella sp.]